MRYFNPHLLHKRASTGLRYFNPALLYKVAGDPAMDAFNQATQQRADREAREAREAREEKERIRRSNPAYDTTLRKLYPTIKEPVYSDNTKKSIEENITHRSFDRYGQWGNLDFDNSKVGFKVGVNGGNWKRYIFTNKTIPYYDVARAVLNGAGKLTNREMIDMEAGWPGYTDALINHYLNIPTEDFIRAGLYRHHASGMKQFANAVSPKPIYEKDNWRSYYMPGETIHLATKVPWYIRRATTATEPFPFYPHGNDSHTWESPVSLGTKKNLGDTWWHEYDHYRNMTGYGSIYNPGLIASLFYGIPRKGEINNQEKKEKQGESFNPGWNFGRNFAPLRVFVNGTWDAPGITGVPANPALRTIQAPTTDEDSTNNRYKIREGTMDYARNHEEIKRSLASLSTGQSLLQESIKKNPQEYLKAGITQEEIDEFLKLPKLPDSIEDFDRRMEFYLNHPIFRRMIGEEPASILNEYWWLEQERRNPDATPEQRKFNQEFFDFIRANGRVIGQNQSVNPADTGIGRYMPRELPS